MGVGDHIHASVKSAYSSASSFFDSMPEFRFLTLPRSPAPKAPSFAASVACIISAAKSLDPGKQVTTVACLGEHEQTAMNQRLCTS